MINDKVATLLRDYRTHLESQMTPLEVDDLARPLVVLKSDRRPPRRLAAALLAAAVVLLIVVSILLVREAPPPIATAPSGALNGWVAFASYKEGVWGGERDIFIVREGETARRIIGSDSDGLDQICPAFSPDGARLAYGQAIRVDEKTWTDATLVVSQLDAGGSVASVLHEIEIGGAFPPPCATWSPDGRRLAFGVPGNNPYYQPVATNGDVWVVDLDGGQTTMLPGLVSTDLEWSPDGTQLAVAADGRVSVVSVITGELRRLENTSGVTWLTWSPDGSRIAYERYPGLWEAELRVIEIDGSVDNLLASDYEAFYGIGPVWSPNGDRIVYQRMCEPYPTDPRCGTQRGTHEAVLIAPDGLELYVPTSEWFPFAVTWSPDANYILYNAYWGGQDPQVPGPEQHALVAVSIDPKAPSVVLYQDPRISAYDADGLVPTQSWGRQPAIP